MERKTMIGILAGGLVAAGLGIAGLRHASAPDRSELAGAATLRVLGDRIPGSVSPSASKPPAGLGQLPPGQADPPVPRSSSVSAIAVPHLKVPPTRKGLREESRRVARERAIAQGKLPEFDAREKAQAERESKSKADREKRHEAFKKRVAERRKAVEAARKVGLPPPPPEGRKIGP